MSSLACRTCTWRVQTCNIGFRTHTSAKETGALLKFCKTYRIWIIDAIKQEKELEYCLLEWYRIKELYNYWLIVHNFILHIWVTILLFSRTPNRRILAQGGYSSTNIQQDAKPESNNSNNASKDAHLINLILVSQLLLSWY